MKILPQLIKRGFSNNHNQIRILLALIAILMFLMLSKTKVSAQIVDIPDPNFKEYLVNNEEINTNGDDEIQVSEAAAFTGTINCWGHGIKSLSGIEAFSQLTGLDCSMNEIDSLDLSNNIMLEYLDCSYNSWFSLVHLDISGNDQLKVLRCQENFALNEVDISNNLLLSTLSISQVEIDIGNHTDLESLIYTFGSIETLDLSNHVKLKFLYCTYGELKFLNLQNGHNDALMMGDEPGINVIGNDSLCVQVDNLDYCEENWNHWTIASAIARYNTTFTENCNHVMSNSGAQTDFSSPVSIYPIPSSSILNIKAPNKIQSVVLYSVNGQQVIEQSSNGSTAEIDISSLTPGLYIAEVHGNSSVQRQKIVVTD